MKAILRIGQVTGVGVIAECVEEEQQLAAFKELGAGYVQGFGVLKPAPLENLFAS
jgi:EAL domain-containing protein (putative c-di-GMP-specific phosphodiesterase class I)